MADIAGLALAIVTLVDSCVTVSKLFSTARDFSTEAETLRLGLLREEGRLKTWARSWGIPTDGNTNDERLSREDEATKLLMEEAENASIDLYLVQSTLNNMWELLSRGKAMQERHMEKSPAKESNFIKEFLKSGMTTVSSRVRWVVTDKDRLRTLITDLKDHNDGLDRLRPRRETSSPSSREASVTCEVVVATDKLALKLPEEAYEQYPELKQILLMRRRQIDTEADNQHWTRYRPLEIEQWEHKLEFLEGRPSGKRPLARYRQDRNQSAIAVLTEWKYYVSSNSASRNLAMSRVERVAQLLSAGSKPPQFRILDCIGYIQDDRNSRCGLIYEVPPFIGARASVGEQSPQVVSLGEVLRSKARPTLADRFHLAMNLASSMLEFHLANWLHKNFNSDNVIFFVPAGSMPKDADVRSPYIGSFGLSRPDSQYIESELVSSSPNIIDFAYNHPEYHYPTASQTGDDSVVPRFHRAFDVYSLGCVLLEIGLWKPLTTIGWEDRYQTDLTRWRHLLQKCAEKNLGFIAGPIYTEVVLKCLESNVDATDIRKESERVRDFCWEISRKLESLRV